MSQVVEELLSGVTALCVGVHGGSDGHGLAQENLKVVPAHSPNTEAEHFGMSVRGAVEMRAVVLKMCHARCGSCVPLRHTVGSETRVEVVTPRWPPAAWCRQACTTAWETSVV